MKIHEYQAKELFKKAGISVNEGQVASDLSQAQSIARELGFPVVLKVQVLVGGRGKAGGIKLVSDEFELKKAFGDLKTLRIKGYPVDVILIAKAVNIKEEIYLAITIDNIKSDIVLIVSRAGGIEIEETAKTNPEKIHKFYFERQKTIDSSRWNAFVKNIFPDQKSQDQIKDFAGKLLKVFLEDDCSLAEINPLVIDSQGNWWAIDAKINLDDNALFRHPDIQMMRDYKYEDKDEIEAKELGLSLVKLDGNIGCIVNGAGLAMATTDVIKLSGGDPANFLDVGGSSSPEKMIKALQIILRNTKVKAILINIFGGITRCDDIAKGILAAKGQLNIYVPLVVRLTGTNEKEAIELLKNERMNIHRSMREAVSEAVRSANK